jgi:signal transduction histidine kinase
MRTSWCSAIFFSVLLAGPVLANPSGATGANRQSLLGACYVLATADTVSAPEVAASWFRDSTQFKVLQRANIGYQSNTYWVVVPVRNWRPTATYLLELANPHVDRVQLFRITGGRCVPIGSETGDDFPFHTRSISHRNFVWNLEPLSEPTEYFLIRTRKPNSSLSLPLTVFTLDAFERQNTANDIFYGLTFGMMLIIAVYSLMAGMFLKRTVHIAYFFFILSSIVLLATAEGLSFEFLYPGWGQFNSIFRVLAVGLASGAFVIFARLFLDIRRYRPGIDRALKVILVYYLISTLLTPFLYVELLAAAHVAVPAILTTAIAAAVLLVVAAASTLRQQRATATFFLTAYALIFITSLVTVMEDYGWIEKLPFNILFIGSLAEMLVFALALTYQIKNLYEERNTLSVRIRKHQAELLQSYVSGVERERQRVSRELHDDIGSRLTALKRTVEQAGEPLAAVAFQVDALAGDVRSLSHQLAPPSLRASDLVKLVESVAHDARQSGIEHVAVSDFDFPRQVAESVKTEVFRIVQEAVQNVVKHAQATALTIQLFRHEQQLVVTVEDDGRGFDASETAGGIGLATMRTRAASVGGTLEISSTQRGTVVMVVLPFAAA